MTHSTTRDESCFLPPESRGGWCWLGEADEVRGIAGMDPERLDQVYTRQQSIHGGDSWSIVIIWRE